MGFCLFGTVAIAAKHALDHHGLSRVAIVDFDVHHGNGTQDLLWNEARCLFASSHQMPLYPGSGSRSETGAHGQIVNAPLREGSGAPAAHPASARALRCASGNNGATMASRKAPECATACAMVSNKLC